MPYARYAAKTGLTHTQCWAHARRGLFEAEAADPAAVREGLAQIAALYAVEQQIRTLALSGEAKQLHRLTHSKPIVAGFFAWIVIFRRNGATGFSAYWSQAVFGIKEPLPG